MTNGLRRVPTRTLHTLAAGETARVSGILFERLRQKCAALGLEVGQLVTCRVPGDVWLILDVDVAGGSRPVLLERDWARFVEVERPAVTTPGPRAA